MSKNFRVIQLGCGPRGITHAQATRDVEGVELTAICDMDRQRLDAAQKELGITKTYQDFGEMLRKERYDLVDIITPPTIRVEVVEQAAAAGAKAILIEKPIALRPSEARRLAELGRSRLIAVNTQYQWMPHWQNFWKILGKGELGKIQTIRASTRTNILEQGPHIMDLAMKIASIGGLPWPEWVLAACNGLERFGKDPVPADTTATIGLGDARLFLNAGPSAPAVPGEKVYWYHIQVDILGERGRLWVSLNQGWKLWLCRPADKDISSTTATHESGPTSWNKNDGESQRGIIAGLRDAIRDGTEAEFPTRIAVGAHISDLFMGCYESALGAGAVKLPCNADDSVIERMERLGKRS